jgi:hypothetical protein
MSFSPKLNQLVKVRGRDAEDMPDVASAGVPRTDCITPSGQRNLTGNYAKLHDGFRFGVKPVHVDGLVILRISEESNALKPNRTHNSKIRLDRTMIDEGEETEGANKR